MTQLLLQTQYDFLATPDSSAAGWIIGILGAFVVVLVVAGIISGRQRRGSGRRGVSGRFTRRAFLRTARRHGLTRPEGETLLHLVRVAKTRQPLQVFNSQGLLDEVLQRGVYAVDHSNTLSAQDRETRLAGLFAIKRKIERHREITTINTSAAIRPGAEVTIVPEQGGRYPTRVISSLRDNLACLVPMDEQGNQLRWKRGTRVKVLFWPSGDTGYSFVTKILGYETVNGRPAILIKHSHTVARDQQRRHRRRIVERPCFLYPIVVEEVAEGRQTVKRAMVQTNRRALGTLVDISAGGAGIRAMSPVAPGRLVKIEFEFSRAARIAVFGKVRRVRKEGPTGGVMHIQFTRMSRRHLNEIYRYVYEYEAPAPPRGVAVRRQAAAVR